jgi:uncharacterized protein
MEVIKGLSAGTIAGLASGFLGVSPGGILVAVISLFFPYPQRMVQAISLLAQAPPTGLAGVRSYAKKGRRAPLGEILTVAAGFAMGGPAGAAVARLCTDRALRWMYVGYLVLLVLLATAKGAKRGAQEPPSVRDREDAPLVVSQRGWPSLAAMVAIGLIAGASSGLLGIGGGLAITALSVLLLKKDQHAAQALSIAVTMLPLTLPAAWVYARQEWHLPWLAIGCLVAGLGFGAWVGSVFAIRLPERSLKLWFAALLLVMASYMAVLAMRS